jgi:hypothetical protein
MILLQKCISGCTRRRRVQTNLKDLLPNSAGLEELPGDAGAPASIMFLKSRGLIA